MLLLTSTSDKVQVVTASGGAAVKVHASFLDVTTGPTFTALRTNTASITTATTTDVVAAPAASTQRNVKLLVCRNDHASASETVTIQHTDGTNVQPLWKGVLAAGESVIYDQEGDFTKFTASGIAVYQGSPLTTKGDLFGYSTTAIRHPVGTNGQVLASDSGSAAGVKWVNADLTNFSTSTVSAGYSSDTYLAGSSIAVPSGLLRAGTSFYWAFDMVKTAAGTAAATINIRVGTAGTTADSSRCLFTWGAGTAAADSGIFEVWAHLRTVGSGTSAVVVGLAGCRHALAATGLISTGASGHGQLVTVGGGFDSTVANLIVGLSFNGGASFSGTNTLVEASAFNINV